MSNKAARIHHMPFNRKCDAFGCKNTSYGGNKMYAIGIPEHLSAKPVFCEHCVSAFLINLPKELAEIAGVATTDSGEAELLAKIEELTISKTDDALRIAELEALVETLTPASVTPDAGEAEVDDEPADETTKAEDPEPIEGTVIRCLDCGEEFPRQAELTKHKKKVHPEG